jgi:hypothetical protein
MVWEQQYLKPLQVDRADVNEQSFRTIIAKLHDLIEGNIFANCPPFTRQRDSVAETQQKIPLLFTRLYLQIYYTDTQQHCTGQKKVGVLR